MNSLPRLSQDTRDLLLTGIPAIGLLATQAKSTPDLIGGIGGGLVGLGAETAGLRLLAKNKSLDPRTRLGLQMLTGIAPIASEMIGSEVGKAMGGVQ